jgi:tRNA threonylcarbamoyladenosine biosynthesis protein TsaB
MNEGIVLGIDTTGEYGSLALAEGDAVIAQVLLHGTDGHGHTLFERIEDLLTAHDLQVKDIALFAAAKGPGSFTGVRVGLTAAKALAASLGRPAAGVSNLQALALLGEGPRRAAVLDARRNEIYGAVYDDAGRLLTAETVAPFGEWLTALPDGDISFVFIDEEPYLANLAASRFASAGRRSAGRALAGAVARLGWRQAGDPALLDANYVRKADAELFWVDKNSRG